MSDIDKGRPLVTGIPNARITRDGVFIGGQALPGVIEDSGVTVNAGGTRDVFNRLVVTFIVGQVIVEDAR